MASFFPVLALYLQQGHGIGALGSGLVFLPLGIGYFIASTRAATVAAKLGRQVLAVGSLTVAAGYLLPAATVGQIGTAGPVLWPAPGLLLSGAGMGLVMAPLPSIVMAGVAERHSSAASGGLRGGVHPQPVPAGRVRRRRLGPAAAEAVLKHEPRACAVVQHVLHQVSRSRPTSKPPVPGARSPSPGRVTQRIRMITTGAGSPTAAALPVASRRWGPCG